jgi:hypothetical protein
MSARSLSLFAGVCLACLIPAGHAAAADTETRVFSISVDGKPAGEFRMVIRTAGDGTESIAIAASVHVKYLFGGYRYSYRGTEVWKDGRLRQFDSASDDDGKKHTVQAAADGDKLRITVDGAGRSARPDVWPTSYWRMPPGIKQGQTVVLLDADTGEEQAARIDSARPQRDVPVMGKAGDILLVHVTGPTPAELWYDGRGRLFRQETVEDGHKTVLNLREIQR